MDSERLLATLLGKVDEAQGAVEEERAVRIDRETQNLKRVGEDIFRVQEKVDVERCTREGALTAMQAEVRAHLTAVAHRPPVPTWHWLADAARAEKLLAWLAHGCSPSHPAVPPFA